MFIVESDFYEFYEFYETTDTVAREVSAVITLSSRTIPLGRSNDK